VRAGLLRGWRRGRRQRHLEGRGRFIGIAGGWGGQRFIGRWRGLVRRILIGRLGRWQRHLQVGRRKTALVPRKHQARQAQSLAVKGQAQQQGMDEQRDQVGKGQPL
jgi:hypothetical protein